MKAIHKPTQAIKNIRGDPRSYDTENRFEDGSWRVYVTTTCIECARDFDVHWSTGGADPRFVEKKMRGLGWRFDAFKPKQCVCPECVRGRKSNGTDDTTTTTNSEDNDMANTTKPAAPTTPANSYKPPTTDTAVLMAARANNDADDVTGRRLTAHEKARVRSALDSHFDDQLGRYIDGYSDERVGKELDLPWALVTELREFAYGPLKDDPAIAAVKAEVEALRGELVTLSHALDQARATFTKLEGRLVNVEAKARKL